MNQKVSTSALNHGLGKVKRVWNIQENKRFGTKGTDMEFVKKFTPLDFQAKNFTPSISPNFNSFSGKKHKK